MKMEVFGLKMAVLREGEAEKTEKSM